MCAKLHSCRRFTPHRFLIHYKRLSWCQQTLGKISLCFEIQIGDTADLFNLQLSDFGLAIWGPTDLTYRIQEDVAGTFGYIAPEYFMHGRVSDKIDIYSFGVVLLELLSGRRPIYIKNEKGVEESLVKWV